MRYLLQRINDHVFKNVPALMENVQRVTAHATKRAAESGDVDASRRALTLVPARSGLPYHRDAGGGWWRCYLFIEGAHTCGDKLAQQKAALVDRNVCDVDTEGPAPY